MLEYEDGSRANGADIGAGDARPSSSSSSSLILMMMIHGIGSHAHISIGRAIFHRLPTPGPTQWTTMSSTELNTPRSNRNETAAFTVKAVVVHIGGLKASAEIKTG